MTGPRIAIASPGVGRVQRGYERAFIDLFNLMRDDHDITLFKGGGPRSANEKVPLFLHRNSAIVRALPVHKLFHRTPFHSECMMYVLGMMPYLRGGKFDVVHSIDPPLTRLLYRMRNWFGLSFSLLHTEAAGMAPSDYPPADFTQQITPLLMQGAVDHGYRPDLMRVVELGHYPERFETPLDKATLRRNYGIPEDKFVILSVAAINRDQKRIDYLVDEAARLDGNWLLMMDGSPDHGHPELVTYARQKLGDRVRIGHVPSDKVGELYKLADVMAHSSMRESFGLTIIEAASTGLPVLTDDGAHFQWLLPNPACWVDMGKPGALAARLQALMRDPSALAALRSAQLTRERFSWHALKPRYVDLYRHVASLPRHGVAEADCRRAA